MNIGKIFKDAFIYPIKSWKIFIVIGLLLCVSDFSELTYVLLSSRTISIEILFLGLISLIILVILQGYHLSIIRDTFGHSNYLTSFVLDKNFIDGLKVIIVCFVYSMPLIVLLLTSAYFLGFFKLINTNSLYSNYGLNYLNYIFQELLFDFEGIFLFLLFLGIVLLFIISILFVIADSRLAIYGDLGSAFQIIEIFNDISKIGWRNYILWFLIFLLIVSFLYIINGILYFSGSIGVLISLFVIYNYIQIFTSRNIGLIYKMIEKSEEYNVESVYY